MSGVFGQERQIPEASCSAPRAQGLEPGKSDLTECRALLLSASPMNSKCLLRICEIVTFLFYSSMVATASASAV